MMDLGSEETISKPISILWRERDRDGYSIDEAGLEFEAEGWIDRVFLEFVENVFREMVAGIRVVLLEKIRREDELGEGSESSEGGDGLRELKKQREGKARRVSDISEKERLCKLT